MRFDIITIFPNIISAYFNESILKRAIKKGIIDIRVWNLRDFASNNIKSQLATMRSLGRVDDKAYGGGPGMVLKVEPIVRVLGAILKIKNSKALGNQVSKSKILVIFLSAGGKQFNSKMAADFAKKYNHIIFICGHYEGIDERIKTMIRVWGFVLRELSVGPYVLTGGELPAMIIADAVSRYTPGVLGKSESLEEKRYGAGLPVYTRPEMFKHKGRIYKVPKVLLSGNHKKIDEWRRVHVRHNKAIQ